MGVGGRRVKGGGGYRCGMMGLGFGRWGRGGEEEVEIEVKKENIDLLVYDLDQQHTNSLHVTHSLYG